MKDGAAVGEEVEIQRGMEEDVRRGGRMRRNLITLFTVTWYCLHSATNEKKNGDCGMTFSS